MRYVGETLTLFFNLTQVKFRSLFDDQLESVQLDSIWLNARARFVRWSSGKILEV